MHRLSRPHARVLVFATSIVLVISAITSGAFSAQSNDPAYLAAIDFGKHGNESKQLLAGIPNEGPEDTYAAEQAALRAFPADEVPPEAGINSLNTFEQLKQKKAVGQWSPIGPLNRAQYPAVLDQFLFDGAQFNASGRVTAMAIAPSCSTGSCRLYVGAAGGGVWVTDKALSGANANWSFVSGALGSNAIGSILLDPNDVSGNTVYVGTGELNASGDSEAGVGIFKSTNGGQSWSLVPGSDRFYQRSIGKMAFDNAGNLLVPIGSGVRGISSVTSGASSSGSTTHPLTARGLYRQTGATFTLIRPLAAVATARGSSTVKVDPTHVGVIYVNEYSRGIWRSTNNGVSWSQIKTPLNAGRSTDRAEFDVTTLPNGKTRMYVGVGNQSDAGANRARFYRTDDASGAALFTDLTTSQNAGYCTAQCWYDNYVTAVAGSPDIVYLGGSFSYGQLHGPSNGRAVLLSSDGGATFSDLTQDGDPNHAEGMHPDQHALVTVPSDPFTFFAGSDGALIRQMGGQFLPVAAPTKARINAITSAGFNGIYAGLDGGIVMYYGSDAWRMIVNEPKLGNVLAIHAISARETVMVTAKGQVYVGPYGLLR